MTKWVYLFEEGNKDMKNLLGGKGAGLAEMIHAGLPVPPGFTITTEACNEYNALGKKFPDAMWDQTLEAMKTIEKETGKKFGDPSNPLLVSVRSGARVSMPGMMDTVLNLGLNPQTLEGLAKLTNNRRFAMDAYRRFVQMFSRIVLEIKGEQHDPFDKILEEYKSKTTGGQDTDLTADMLAEIVEKFKAVVKDRTGKDFPSDPYEQLRLAIAAVFNSWMGKRAIDYRNYHKLPHDWGTAVNVVTMVFGNMGDDSGTGVAFTRNPATGEKLLYGEYLQNAQGEDVVAGIRTPKKIAMLEKDMPTVYKQFVDVAQMLEKHYRDIQDFEFTIERGKVWMLITRNGRRTATAAIRIAVDMVAESLITRKEAVLRVDPMQVSQVLQPHFDPQAKREAVERGDFLARGLNASAGAASGLAVFDADTAEELGQTGKPVILIRPEQTPDDVHGMLRAKGILTQRGGATSHAAVVARGLGMPCVAGCDAIRIDSEARLFAVTGRIVREFDLISIDGTTGEVFFGQIPMVPADIRNMPFLTELLSWADEFRRLQVWVNADLPEDIIKARKLGAQGIGLCRTEHMFFEEGSLPITQKMILSADRKERQAWLDQLLPTQRSHFEAILEAADGLPVLIRLIDPPLGDFLPALEELLVEVTEFRLGLNAPGIALEKEKLLTAVQAMHEINPIFGLRGVRLGIVCPEIIEMQVRAITEAACNCAFRGIPTTPKVLIPMVSEVRELMIVRKTLEDVSSSVVAERGVNIGVEFGIMVETPRAAITAGELAERADFLLFGSNDLTQAVFGYSRDDAEGKFLLKYVEDKILPADPFRELDREGVGCFVGLAIKSAHKVRPDLVTGICGEQASDPSSIQFFHDVGLDFLSCGPWWIPVARLAAAQAAIRYTVFPPT